MGFQFQSVASVAPFLVDDFHIGYGQVGMLMGLYLLPGGVIALPGGMLGQRFGERRLCADRARADGRGRLGMAASESFAAASAGRIVSGIGGVLLNVLLAKMVADWFRDKEMATAMGVMLTSWPIGMGLALATLGTLAAVSLVAWGGARDRGRGRRRVRPHALYSIGIRRQRAPESMGPHSSGSRRGAGARHHRGARVGRVQCELCRLPELRARVAQAVGGRSVGAAGAIVSLGIWVTLGSIPLGGLLADRLGRPGLLIGAGSVSVALAMLAFPYFDRPALWCVLVGILAGARAGGAHGAPAQGPAPAGAGAGIRRVYYTVFYLSMAAMPGVAGGLRDRYESPAAPSLRRRPDGRRGPGARRLPHRGARVRPATASDR